WYESLSRLVAEPDLRERVANAAYRDVLWRFGPERRSLLVTRLVNSLVNDAPVVADLHRAAFGRDDPGPVHHPPTSSYDVIYATSQTASCRVSVVIPLFNYANLLREALESVRDQTLSRVDLVVVDDHSTDDSLAVALEWIGRYGDRFN